MLIVGRAMNIKENGKLIKAVDETPIEINRS